MWLIGRKRPDNISIRTPNTAASNAFVGELGLVCVSSFGRTPSKILNPLFELALDLDVGNGVQALPFFSDNFLERDWGGRQCTAVRPDKCRFDNV